MTNKSKGELTEQIVLTELMKRGIVCSKPLGDNQPYDLIIEVNNQLYKVQIRIEKSESNITKNINNAFDFELDNVSL